MRIAEVNNINDYSTKIADYLCEEYGDISKELCVNDEQKNIVASIIHYCYENQDSINNAGNYLIEFMRK